MLHRPAVRRAGRTSRASRAAASDSTSRPGIDQVSRRRRHRLARRSASAAGSNSMRRGRIGALTRRRIVSAMPPCARPTVRAETIRQRCPARMPDARIDAAQSVEEGTVLAERHRRHAAGAVIRCDSHGNARAGFLVVPRPGIRGIRIEQRAHFIEQRGISPFARINCMDMRWDPLRSFGFDHCATRHRVRPLERGQIGGDPVRPDVRIGIGREQHTVTARQIGGAFHGDPPRAPGVGAAIGQRHLDRMHPERQVIAERAHHIGRSVAAIVQAESTIASMRAARCAASASKQGPICAASSRTGIATRTGRAAASPAVFAFASRRNRRSDDTIPDPTRDVDRS